ncbi:MAG: class I SAM-dependent methyltransferase [Candidatus Margulisiibacteriota bacterium]
MKIYCPVCTVVTDVEFVNNYEHKNKLFENKKLYQCLNCKLIFVHPMPTENALDEYYKKVWLNDERIIARNIYTEMTYQIQAQERIKYLLKHNVLLDGMKVLDVGGGYGYLYDSFKEHGFNNIEYYMTDPSPDNVERLRSKGGRAFAELEDVKEHEFDLVTVCFVLEHIPEPVKFLSNILEYVRDGGYVFIDLPERDDTFKPFIEPHVTVYSMASLTHLVNKLKLEMVHITGYGIERARIKKKIDDTIPGEMTEIKGIAVIIRNLINKVKGIIKCVYLRNYKKRFAISRLYHEYKFDEEGQDRWWIRAILRKS